jgi:hypothetical protein
MADFSPGPWMFCGAEYTETGGYIEPTVFSFADPNNPKIVCVVSTRDGATEVANGNMIAAAPELCEALKSALQCCPCSLRERDSGHRVDCYAPAALSALAKAEGTAVANG